MGKLEELKLRGEAPEWMKQEGFATLEKGYLLENETPKKMYERVSSTVASYLNRPDLAEKFFNYIWNNWLCLSTPVQANSGTDRGLVISCFGSVIPDSITGIFSSFHETAMLSKYGGGTSAFWGNLRPRGAAISSGGTCDGVIPWQKVQEQTLHSVSQGGVRRGSGAQYLSVWSPDAEEFCDIRRQTGADQNRRCLTEGYHHGFCIDDKFMNACKDGDSKARNLWEKILKARMEKGEPYLFFEDTVRRNDPECYKARGLSTKASNLCSEICLHADEDHTFVCCLSSLNLARYDEWKDTDLIETGIYFLDGVISEFIDKASRMPGLEKAVAHAVKGRALGLGYLGWHTLLQKNNIPFESFAAMQLNNEVHRKLQRESKAATRKLAEEYGEPEWCKGFGIRNTHTNAIAPTLSNSIISGGVSQGIEPIITNYYGQKTAKGTFIRKNPILEDLLESRNKNTFEVWEEILSNNGSVSSLKFLSEREKQVFATAREINQTTIIQQAAQRQPYIDQGQSVNIFVDLPEDLTVEKRKELGKRFHNIHWLAWELGLKTMYYCRGKEVVSGDAVFESDCKACEA